MKGALFILCYAAFYVPSACSSSLLQPHFKGKSSQTSTKEIAPSLRAMEAESRGA